MNFLLGIAVARSAVARSQVARLIPGIVLCSIAVSSVWADDPPGLQREFRAAWIATVANIDWPSSSNLSAEEQQAELVRLFDVAVETNLNAVVLQVRPACDAMYRSEIEPWSPWLVGQMGRVPDEAYDPLEFAVEQAHRRGLQLHAWLNPYRASHPSYKKAVSSDHVSNVLPHAVVKYGRYLWLDPGEPAAEEQTLRVVKDLVRRYDIDGIHFDDYFYPYPISSRSKPASDNGLGSGKESVGEVPFPDDASWQAYCQRVPVERRLSRDDWRRENVNRLVRRVRQTIQDEKSWVAFGVSPFGIWRPGTPPAVQGFDPYAKLYADSRLWLKEGWVDYAAPQLYWPIRSSGQSFPVLLDWWRRQNKLDRHLFVGLYTSRIGPNPNGTTIWEAREVIDQVQIAQSYRGVAGGIHFSIKALAENRDGIADALREGPYATPALTPEFNWLAPKTPCPAPPRLSKNATFIRLQPACEQPVRTWGIQCERNGNWRTKLLPGSATKFDVSSMYSSGQLPSRVVVRAVDRIGRASSPSSLELITD